MMDALAAVPVGTCVRLCMGILQQLEVSKHNKKECKSLKVLIECIADFLEKLPDEGLSQEGSRATSRFERDATLGRRLD